MIVGFYFLLIRPQRNRQRAQQALVASLEVGDDVMTTGGIFGTIVEIDDDEGTVTVEIAPGTRIRMLRAGHLPALRRGRRRRGRRDGRRGDRPRAVSVEPAPAEGPSEPAEPASQPEGITLEFVQQDEELSSFITAADRVMEGLGYTEHGFRHANLTARIAFNVLSRAGFDTHTANLACVAGYLHDVGNMISRYAHGQTGGVLVYQALRDRVPSSDLAQIVAAVANHEEDNGYAVSPVSAAVILADKSDVHRSRVRKSGQIEFDIHDRVNYAAEQSFLRVDSAAKTVSLELTIDTKISQVMEYFEIFLGRMQLCRLAAEVLNCRFKLLINGAELA